MEIKPNTHLNLAGLVQYNELLNLRNRNRLKYKGEWNLKAATRLDWQDLGRHGCAVGDLYKLSGGGECTINNRTYKSGSWILVKTYGQRKYDDINYAPVVDRDGETPVTIEVEPFPQDGHVIQHVLELPDTDISEDTIYGMPENYYACAPYEKFIAPLDGITFTVEEHDSGEDEITVYKDGTLLGTLYTGSLVPEQIGNKIVWRYYPSYEYVLTTTDMPQKWVANTLTLDSNYIAHIRDVSVENENLKYLYYIYNKESDFWTCLNDTANVDIVKKIPQLNDSYDDPQIIYAVEYGTGASIEDEPVPGELYYVDFDDTDLLGDITWSENYDYFYTSNYGLYVYVTSLKSMGGGWWYVSGDGALQFPVFAPKSPGLKGAYLLRLVVMDDGSYQILSLRPAVYPEKKVHYYLYDRKLNTYSQLDNNNIVYVRDELPSADIAEEQTIYAIQDEGGTYDYKLFKDNKWQNISCPIKRVKELPTTDIDDQKIYVVPSVRNDYNPNVPEGDNYRWLLYDDTIIIPYIYNDNHEIQKEGGEWGFTFFFIHLPTRNGFTRDVAALIRVETDDGRAYWTTEDTKDTDSPLILWETGDIKNADITLELEPVPCLRWNLAFPEQKIMDFYVHNPAENTWNKINECEAILEVEDFPVGKDIDPHKIYAIPYGETVFELPDGYNKYVKANYDFDDTDKYEAIFLTEDNDKIWVRNTSFQYNAETGVWSYTSGSGKVITLTPCEASAANGCLSVDASNGIRSLMFINRAMKAERVDFYYFSEERNKWVKFGGGNGGILFVELLPAEPNDECLYVIERDVYQFIERMSMKAQAITDGYSCDVNGITKPDGVWVSWAEAAIDATETIALLESNEDGEIYHYLYDNTDGFSFNSEPDLPYKREMYGHFYGSWYLLWDSIGNANGASNYNRLANKPMINSVLLESNKNTEEIKITWYGTQDEYDNLPEHNDYTLYIITDGEHADDILVDYTTIENRPQINSVEVIGDKNSEELKITWIGTQVDYDALADHNQYTLYIITDGNSIVDDSNYNNLDSKPAINGVVLTGNKALGEFDLYSKAEVDNLLSSLRSIKVVPTKPATPTANTMYYVGSTSPYRIFLYDSNKTEIDLGDSSVQFGDYQTKVDAGLATSSKNVVGAINELTNVIGDGNLDTEAHNLTRAVNEVYAITGNTELTTTNKDLTRGVNELNTNIGTLSGLDTNAKENVIAAINELHKQDPSTFVYGNSDGAILDKLYGIKLNGTMTMNDVWTKMPGCFHLITVGGAFSNGPSSLATVEMHRAAGSRGWVKAYDKSSGVTWRWSLNGDGSLRGDPVAEGTDLNVTYTAGTGVTVNGIMASRISNRHIYLRIEIKKETVINANTATELLRDLKIDGSYPRVMRQPLSGCIPSSVVPIGAELGSTGHQLFVGSASSIAANTVLLVGGVILLANNF